jgi:hypothetical protein
VTKQKLQFIVVIVIVAVWVVGLILSVFDGNTLAKATTPLMTLVFGWLFAQNAVSG